MKGGGLFVGKRMHVLRTFSPQCMLQKHLYQLAGSLFIAVMVF
jgi:hypothetical protein